MKDILLKKILIICLIFWPAATRALTVTHHLDAVIGRFNAATADFGYRLGAADYGVYSHIRTNGLFDTLYPFSAQYSGSGKIVADRAITETYHYQTQSRFTKRTKQLLYNDKGLPIKRISSKNGREKIRDVEARDDIDGTTDLQTAVALLIRQYFKQQNCNFRQRVFDGKRRFDVIFKDLGTDELPPHEKSPYSGIMQKCSMYIDRLQEKNDDMLWQMTVDRPVYFWIMRDDKTKAPLLVRIKIDETPLGEMNVYTTKIEVTE